MSDDGWADGAGLVVLPSGVRVRGRRIGDAVSPADFALLLADGPAPAWAHRRIRWPDFWVPVNRADALDALHEAHRRALAGSGSRLRAVAGLVARGRGWLHSRSLMASLHRNRSRGCASTTTHGRLRRRGSDCGCVACAD